MKKIIEGIVGCISLIFSIRGVKHRKQKEKLNEIIKSGKVVVKGYGLDEGKFFLGTAHLSKESGRVTVEYFCHKSEKTPAKINAHFVSIEEFLSWQTKVDQVVNNTAEVPADIRGASSLGKF